MTLESNRMQSLETPVPKVFESDFDEKTDINAIQSLTLGKNKDYRCYYGDSSISKNLHFFYGQDIPISGKSCLNGLCSMGQQTQMYFASVLYKYPYFHPVAIIYSLLFLWWIQFQILRVITVVTIIFIQFTIGESLKIYRHSSTETLADIIHVTAQLIGDILLIPYQCFVVPSENPLVQFQNTSFNRSVFANCKSMLSFSPTFWMRNTLLQFIWVCLEEQFLPKTQCKIYRECLETADGGLIALDWWLKTSDTDDNPKYAQHGNAYKSKIYHQWNEQSYNADYKFEDGDMTPILFIFTTYCGDSMSTPVRKMAEYFTSHGWRVVSYTKRGCGSPYYEMLPLLNHKTFDLSGMDDAELAVQCVVKRYPLVPKICLGFSLGGSQCQDYLGRYNVKHHHFIGGIKIDGICKWTELIKFGVQHNTFTKVLGEVVHSSYVKSLFSKDFSAEGIDYEKIKELQKNAECKSFNFAKIASMKSADCEILDVVKDVMSPAKSHGDYMNYLHSVLFLFFVFVCMMDINVFV